MAVLSLGGYLYLRRSLPTVDGTIEIAGPNGQIDIIRDADNIPHIFAATKSDALFGLGYVHAQDRLWQMELQRRIGFGRLSEIFGPAALAQDRFLRTVGFGRAARSAWSHLPEDARQQVDSYVAGVNAFIANRGTGALPPEFTLLRFEPEPWTGADIVVWAKMMAWDLSSNYSYELLRRDLLARVGPERMTELMPPLADNSLNILGSAPAPAPDAQAPRQTLNELARAWHADHPESNNDSWSSAFSAALTQGVPFLGESLLKGGRSEALGSNNWVVDGTLTASGKPLLANDPHLATHIPSIWYLAHMSAGDFDVIGATLPGGPVVATGRNRFIGWGVTNVAADVEDLYLERIDPTGEFAEFQGVQEPLQHVNETIVVKGYSPVELDVRITRHGPLISDAINAINAEASAQPLREPLDPIAFRWTALDEIDNTVAAFLRLNEARNWTEFTDALREYSCPSQNIVYADVDGHIGYYAPGHIPIRGGGDGKAPAEGWSGEMEWTGWIPFEELPHVFDPPEHFIATANNRPVAPGYPYLVGNEFPDPYRAQRITDLLRQKQGFTPDDFRAIQADTFSSHAQTLLPVLLEHAAPQTDADRQAVEVLKAWDYDASANSAAEPIFQAWFLNLARVLAGDELGPRVLDAYRGRFSEITRFIRNTLAAGDSAWCDDVTTEGKKETCDEVVTVALHEGVEEMTRRLGADMTNWRWEAVHPAVFPHQGLDAVAMLRPILNRSIPSAGDWSTVNAGTVAVDHLYEQRAIPGYRHILDLSPANDSRFLDAVGQSGHFLSPHYDDFLPDWQAVRHRRMRMDRAQIEEGALGHLRLVPPQRPE